MSYLIPSDYKKQIQTDNLNQVIGSDTTILSAAERTAVEEASSYLVQKYLLTQELTDLFQWDKTIVYNAGGRVFLDAPMFVFTSTVSYTAADYVQYQAKIYKALVNIASAASWNPADWAYVCEQYQVFNAVLPKPAFDYQAPYKTGDQVFYKNKVYTAQRSAIQFDDSALLQFGQIKNIPYPNVFPDDPAQGIAYWGTGTAYAVPANTDILNTTYWAMGDTRSQQMVTYLIDMTLYHVHCRIAPRNIPDLRVKRYDDAISWLKKCANGDVTPNLPVLQPRQGARIRFGGNIKNANSY